MAIGRIQTTASQTADAKGSRSSWIRLTTTFRRFRSEENGVAALEFALIGPFFLMLLLSITDIGIYFLMNRTVEASANIVAREIKTQQITTGTSIGDLRQKLCDLPTMQMFSCSNIYINVQQVGSFGQPGGMKRKPDGSLDSDDFGANMGGSGTINIMHVYVNWPTLQTWVNAGEWVDGERMIMATTAFLTE